MFIPKLIADQQGPRANFEAFVSILDEPHKRGGIEIEMFFLIPGSQKYSIQDGHLSQRKHSRQHHSQIGSRTS
jgi:hypothetical protein